MRRVCTRSNLVVALVGVTSVATGQEALDAPPIDISYSAHGKNCPNRDEFVAWLQQALASSSAQQARDPRQFTVLLENDHGVLKVRGEEGGTSTHEVRGANCAEVGNALALSLALAIDASAPHPVPPSTQAQASAAPKPTALQPPTTESSESGPAKWAAGVGAIGAIGPTSPAFGGTVFLDLPKRQDRMVAPQLRFGAAYMQSTVLSAHKVGVHWSWYVIRAELCGLHIAAASYGLRVCAALDTGLIVSYPGNLQASKTEPKGWFAPSLGVRSFWQNSDFSLELGTGLSFPLTRYRYYRDTESDNDADLHQIRAIGGTFFLGVAYRGF